MNINLNKYNIICIIMQFTIENNEELVNCVNKLDIENQNKFINKILVLGFTEYKKQFQEDLNIKTDLERLNDKYDKQYENIRLLITELKLENEKNNLILNKNNNKGNLGETLIYEFFKN